MSTNTIKLDPIGQIVAEIVHAAAPVTDVLAHALPSAESVVTDAAAAVEKQLPGVKPIVDAIESLVSSGSLKGLNLQNPVDQARAVQSILDAITAAAAIAQPEAAPLLALFRTFAAAGIAVSQKNAPTPAAPAANDPAAIIAAIVSALQKQGPQQPAPAAPTATITSSPGATGVIDPHASHVDIPLPMPSPRVAAAPTHVALAPVAAPAPVVASAPASAVDSMRALANSMVAGDLTAAALQPQSPMSTPAAPAPTAPAAPAAPAPASPAAPTSVTSTVTSTVSASVDSTPLGIRARLKSVLLNVVTYATTGGESNIGLTASLLSVIIFVGYFIVSEYYMCYLLTSKVPTDLPSSRFADASNYLICILPIISSIITYFYGMKGQLAKAGTVIGIIFFVGWFVLGGTYLHFLLTDGVGIPAERFEAAKSYLVFQLPIASAIATYFFGSTKIFTPNSTK